MRPYLFEFRQLFNELNRRGADLGAILTAWATRHAAILASHSMFREFDSLENSYTVENEDLCSFYALSRVCDYLIASFEPPDHSVNGRNRAVASSDLSLAQFIDFWESIGISPRQTEEYHPFWCEIAAIEAADAPDAPPQIEEVFWPALSFGNLLICRAGVRVRAGSEVLNPAIAAASPLYFTYWRANRTVHDLSHGWGSNSQWNTAFRRDYVWRQHFIFNADGAPGHRKPPFLSELTWHEVIEPPTHRFFASQNGDRDGLTLAQREELLANRCFVRDQTDDDEFWPYDDTLLLQIKSA